MFEFTKETNTASDASTRWSQINIRHSRLTVDHRLPIPEIRGSDEAQVRACMYWWGKGDTRISKLYPSFGRLSSVTIMGEWKNDASTRINALLRIRRRHKRTIGTTSCKVIRRWAARCCVLDQSTLPTSWMLLSSTAEWVRREDDCEMDFIGDLVLHWQQ